VQFQTHAMTVMLVSPKRRTLLTPITEPRWIEQTFFVACGLLSSELLTTVIGLWSMKPVSFLSVPLAQPCFLSFSLAILFKLFCCSSTFQTFQENWDGRDFFSTTSKSEGSGFGVSFRGVKGFVILALYSLWSVTSGLQWVILICSAPWVTRLYIRSDCCVGHRGCGVGIVRSRRFLGGAVFLTTLGFFCPTPDAQSDHFLHHTSKLGIPVELVQFLLKLLLNQRFLAMYHDFHWF